MIFDASGLSDITVTLGAMFGFRELPFISMEALYYLKSYGIILIMAVIGSTPLPKQLCEKLASSRTGEKIMPFLTPLCLAGLLLIMTAYLVDGSYNPFLYFRF